MIKVSVIVATYNQEKYILQALESIVAQKTDFEYEVIVGDDASKDGTAALVRDFAAKHPGVIRAILREKNLGAAPNFTDLCLKAQGEYMAFLEGDDYWLDEQKLSKQVAFLDEHPDYVGVFGNNIIVDREGNRNEKVEKYMPTFAGGEYLKKDYEEYLLPGQTATAMYRTKAIFEFYSVMKKIKPRVPVIDRFIVLGMLSIGRLFRMEDTFAAYRYVLDQDSGSWSSKNDFFSFKNMVFYLYSLKEIERVGKLIGYEVNFDMRRNYEFAKIATYKKEMSIISINIIRFFIWLWYKDKSKFYEFVRGRHQK